MAKFFLPAVALIALGLAFQFGRFGMLPNNVMVGVVFGAPLLMMAALAFCAWAKWRFGWRSVWVWLATAVGCFFASSPVIWLLTH